MTQTRTDVTVIVPTNQLMASLLGQRDEHLRQIEAAFPGTDIRVRGNEVVIEGAEAARVAVEMASLAAAIESIAEDPNN